MSGLLEKMMEHGVPDNQNISIRDKVTCEFPLQIPFNIDDQTTLISSVKLHYKVGVESEDMLNGITVLLDDTKCEVISETKGTIDLTAWVSTPGWHEIEIHSHASVKVIGQLSIKSFIRF